MPIRFSCPSCQQPIEIDDEWAGQSVACPYCKRVVSAPRESSWPSGQVPMASPAGLTPPPPPGGVPTPPPLPGRHVEGGAAGWGLTLALISVALWLSGLASLFVGVMNEITKRVGPDTSKEEISRMAEQMVYQRTLPVSGFVTAVVILGLLCAMLGLFLGARALIRGERRRTVAVFACAIGAMLVCCQGLFALNLFVYAGSPPPQTAPAVEESAPDESSPDSLDHRDPTQPLAMLGGPPCPHRNRPL